MSKTVTLDVKFLGEKAAADARALRDQVSGVFKQITARIEEANAAARELTFDPRRLLAGADQAERGLKAMGASARTAAREVQELAGQADTAGAGVKALGGQATGAQKKLETLAGSGAAVGTALEDMGAKAGAADAALDALDEGAAAAQKSVAGLGRSAAGALTKIEALDAAAFDPARIVAGADRAVTALDRVKVAGAQARAAVRGAGGGGFFIGGSGRAGGAEEGRPGTFREGMRAGGGAALDLGSGLAAITTIAAAVTGKLSANFDNLIQGVRGNTTMTAADEAGMRAQTLRLMRTGSSSEELAQGYKHIVNMGYHGQDAARIAEFGNRFGIGTHTNVEQTDDFLARIMNALGHLGPGMVSRIGNVGHFAAAGSNMDVKDLEKNSARTVGLASNYIGAKGLPDVLAAYSALVQHSINPARADTQIAGMLGQIAAPSAKAQKRAAALGIGDDFNAVGLRRENLSGVLDKVKAAVDKLSEKDRAGALKDLFNNKQGGIGATFLTGAARPSYQQALNDPRTGTKAAFEGKIDAISPAFDAQMRQTTQAFKALSGEIQSDFIPVGRKMGPLFLAAIPVVRETAHVIAQLLDGFTRLPKPVQEAVLAVGGLKLLSSFLPMLTGFALVSEKTGAVLGGLGKMLLGLGPAAAEGGAGVEGAAAVMSGPFALGVAAVVAAVGGLALAWHKDFGGIREFTAGTVKQITGFFRQNMPLIQQTVRTVLSAVERFWHDHGSRIMAVVTPLWNFLKSTITNAVRIIENVIKLALDLINGNWKAAGRDLLGIVGSLWDEIKSLVVNGVKAVGNALAGIVEIILDLGKRVYTAGASLGDSIASGIKSGIAGAAHAVVSAASGLASSAVAAVKDHLQIHSPSRVMHGLGVNAAQGLADGLTEGGAAVGAAASRAADLVWQKFQIRHRARMSGPDAGSDRSQAADRRDYALTALTAQAATQRGRAQAEAHEFDRAFDGQQAQDSHFHAKWQNRLTDNASYQAYLQRRQAQLQAWGAAHKAWLDAHEAGARRFQSLETAIGNAMAEVGGRVQTAQARLDKAAATAKAKAAEINQGIEDQLGAIADQGPDRFSRAHARNLKQYQDALKTPGVDANAAGLLFSQNDGAITRDQAAFDNENGDRKIQLQTETGEKSLSDALAYFKGRLAALEQTGGKYTSEWGEVYDRVRETQRQITEAERQAADDEEKSLRARFDALKESFDGGRLSMDAYKTALAALQLEIARFGQAHPDGAPALEGIRHDIGGVGAKAEGRERRRQTVGGDQFWDGLASSAAEQGGRVLDALFHPKDKKKIFQSMWEDFKQSGLEALKGGLSGILKNLLTGGGSGGGLNLGGVLGRLFGGLFGGRKSSAMPAGGGSALGAAGAALSAVGLPGGAGLSMLGMGGDPGMGGGGGSPFGLLGMLGKGGLGGLFGHGAMGGFGAALPWIGGGLALNGLLGNPFGKLFRHLHFAEGGWVPGHGQGDTVPALLSPGEFVLSKPMLAAMDSPRSQARGAGGGSALAPIVFNDYGDKHIHSQMDADAYGTANARKIERARRRGVPPS